MVKIDSRIITISLMLCSSKLGKAWGKINIKPHTFLFRIAWLPKRHLEMDIFA
jgi:hypothetical protein